MAVSAKLGAREIRQGLTLIRTIWLVQKIGGSFCGCPSE